MSDTTTLPTNDIENGLPHEWDERLRWPPYYGIFRNGVSLEEVAKGLVKAQICPLLDPNETREAASSRTFAECERALRGAGSGYVILPLPWRTIEKQAIGNGAYSQVVWYREEWWQLICRENPNHFAVPDPSDPTLISFFPTSDKG